MTHYEVSKIPYNERFWVQFDVLRSNPVDFGTIEDAREYAIRKINDGYLIVEICHNNKVIETLVR